MKNLVKEFERDLIEDDDFLKDSIFQSPKRERIYNAYFWYWGSNHGFNVYDQVWKVSKKLLEIYKDQPVELATNRLREKFKNFPQVIHGDTIVEIFMRCLVFNPRVTYYRNDYNKDYYYLDENNIIRKHLGKKVDRKPKMPFYMFLRDRKKKEKEKSIEKIKKEEHFSWYLKNYKSIKEYIQSKNPKEYVKKYF